MVVDCDTPVMATTLIYIYINHDMHISKETDTKKEDKKNIILYT